MCSTSQEEIEEVSRVQVLRKLVYVTEVGWKGVTEWEGHNEGFILARSLVAWATDDKARGDSHLRNCGQEQIVHSHLCPTQSPHPTEISSRNIMQTAPSTRAPHPSNPTAPC